MKCQSRLWQSNRLYNEKKWSCRFQSHVAMIAIHESWMLNASSDSQNGAWGRRNPHYWTRLRLERLEHLVRAALLANRADWRMVEGWTVELSFEVPLGRLEQEDTSLQAVLKIKDAIWEYLICIKIKCIPLRAGMCNDPNQSKSIGRVRLLPVLTWFGCFIEIHEWSMVTTCIF